MSPITPFRASLILVALFALGSQSASAILIENVTDGTVIFSDNGFEDDAPTANPNAPTVGSWTVNEPAAGFTVDVTDAVTPGAFDGSNYAQISRTANGNNASLVANFAAQDSGDVLRFTFAWRYGAGASQVRLGNLSQLRISPNNNANYEVTRTTAFDPKVSSFVISTTEWQTIVIEHELGTNDLSLSVDGAPAEVLTTTVSGGTITSVTFSTNALNSTFYIDALPVPEPASAMLVVAGLVAVGLGRPVGRRVV